MVANAYSPTARTVAAHVWAPVTGRAAHRPRQRFPFTLVAIAAALAAASAVGIAGQSALTAEVADLHQTITDSRSAVAEAEAGIREVADQSTATQAVLDEIEKQLASTEGFLP